MGRKIPRYTDLGDFGGFFLDFRVWKLVAQAKSRRAECGASCVLSPGRLKDELGTQWFMSYVE